MKRIVVCATLVIALALSAVATAGFPAAEYNGTAEGDSFTQIHFDVDKVNGVRKVRHVTFSVPMACYNLEFGREEGEVKGGFRVKDNRFGGTRRWEFGDNEGDVEFRGRLRPQEGVARGTIRADKDEGSAPDPPCYSGELRWEAERD